MLGGKLLDKHKKYSNLGPLLESIIQKGLDMKNPSVIRMATVLATHLSCKILQMLQSHNYKVKHTYFLSVYPELHHYILNREFVAYTMGLLEPNMSEFLANWLQESADKNAPDC